MNLGFKLNKSLYVIDIVDKLLQYRLIDMLSSDNARIEDLHKINLLSQNEAKIIKYTDGKQIYRDFMVVMMVSNNIINGDKNDFSKFSTYLKTLPEIKHLVQYLDRKCMLSLVDTKVTFQIYKLARPMLCVNLIPS